MFREVGLWCWFVDACVVGVCLPTPFASGSPASFSRADELLRKGAYAEAIQAYGEVANNPETRVRRAIGLGYACLGIGRYDEAGIHLEAVRDSARESDSWFLARAEWLVKVGRYDEAIGNLKEAIGINPRNTGARRLLGQVYELTGDRLTAVETYAWFDALLREMYPAEASILCDAGIAIARHAILSRRPDATRRVKYVLHELLQPAGERVDPDYWPAKVASADLLLSKYNLVQAREDYEAALKRNPRLVRAHVGLGLIALDRWAFEDVEEHVSAALEINPRSPDVHVLRARLHMTSRRYDQAIHAAMEALETNPNHVEALALLASGRLLLRDIAGMQAAVKRARSINPNSAVVPCELGTWLVARRRFTEAEAYFKEASDLAPEWADPLTALGLLYMETGEEGQARRYLDRSWEIDPFNERTFHTLNLLDDLEAFGRDETEHFIIKSGEGPDAIIRPYVAEYLEGIYADVCGRFGCEPSAKTIVEVFPDHRDFAIRITGRPFFHTIGACTGRVIAIDAPAGDVGGHLFNWQRVLRHEFVHTVTAVASRYRVPHWLTEGLAVQAEGDPRSWQWRTVLAMAIRRGKLFDLESIDWAFARPRRPGARMLAYAQSEWMVEFIEDRFGSEMIPRMLSGFADDMTQQEVFDRIVERSPDSFLVEFTDWAKRRAGQWKLPLTPIPPMDEIKDRLAETDSVSKARLLLAQAESYLADGEVDEAHQSIRQALELSDTDATAYAVLMDVLLRKVAGADDKDAAKRWLSQAAEWAERLKTLEPDHPQAAYTLAVAAIDAGRREDAIPHLQNLQKVWPVSTFSYECLSDIYMEQDRKEDALRQLVALARLQTNNAELLVRIAEIQKDAGRRSDAVDWLKQSLSIVPYSAEVHSNLAELLVREERFGEAVETLVVLTRIEPAHSGYQSRLAFALQRAGRTEEARTAARRAVLLDPESPAKNLLGP